MNQLEQTYANYIDEVCRLYNAPDAAGPLIEGYAALLEAQNKALTEGAIVDKIKAFGKNTILPLLVSVCLGSGVAHGADDGSEFNECFNTEDCAAQINELKAQNAITPEQLQEVKRIAENDRLVEYCKVFPSGILCKQRETDRLGYKTTAVIFTPTKHIDGVPDDVYSIHFINTTSRSSTSRTMTFSTGADAVSYKASTYKDEDGNYPIQQKGEVDRYDEFSGLITEEYSYQSVLDYINKIYNACKH